MQIVQNVLLVLILIGIVYLIAHQSLLTAFYKTRHYMKISFNILTEDLSTADKSTIKLILGVTTQEDFAEVLGKIAKTAFLEYCRMISGSGTPSKIDEIRMERLFLLVQHYFKEKFPNENQVDNIFHLGAKTKILLQSTISHYRTQLTYLNTWLLGYLNAAIENDGNYQFECSSLTIIQELNSIVKRSWPTLETIAKVPKTSSLYQCPTDTYNKLKTYLNV